jgi:tartrate dehydrogenase/decarboxylase/D-malate dehydrogenase
MAIARRVRIAVVPGDGIGQEVVAEGIRVLERLDLDFEFESFPWGCQYYLQTGQMMAADGVEALKAFDAIYFGAVGWPGVPDHVSLWGLRLAI